MLHIMLACRFFASFHRSRSLSGFPQHNGHLLATSLRVGIGRWLSDVTRFSRRPRVAGQLPRVNSQRPAKAYQLGNARTQAALRRTFEDLCKEGRKSDLCKTRHCTQLGFRVDDISPVSAYAALQNCGRQLVDASPQARITLADQFISTLRSKGMNF